MGGKKSDDSAPTRLLEPWGPSHLPSSMSFHQNKNKNKPTTKTRGKSKFKGEITTVVTVQQDCPSHKARAILIAVCLKQKIIIINK